MDDATSTKLTLVQPTRKREWQLRRGDDVVAELELPSLRSGGRGRIGERELVFETRGFLRREHVLTEAAGGAELGRIRGGKVELEGEALAWRSLGRGRGYGLQDQTGETVLRGKVSKIFRTSGQIEVEPGRDAGLPALVAAYLLIRRAEEIEAAAATTVVVT